MEAKPDKFLEQLASARQALLSYITNLLWNKNDLEDALQNILAEAYSKYAKFEPGSSFKSWIFQIATFTIFNMNRKYHKETDIHKSISPGLDFPSPEYIPNPDYQRLLAGNDHILEKISDEVKSSLSVLNEQERSVFLLRSLAEFNYEEIARTLQVPVGTVMSNLSRSRAKLRNELAGYLKEGGVI